MILPIASFGESQTSILPISSRYPAYVDVRDCGAVSGDGNSDTAAFNRALVVSKNSGRPVLAVGSYDLGDLTWPVVSGGLNVIYAAGRWTLSETLHVPSFTKISGLGGEQSTGFGKGAGLFIIAPTSNVPAIVVTGASDHWLENITMFITSANDSIGIHADGRTEIGALLWMDNVNVSAQSGSDAIPFQASAFFWIFCEGSSFSSSTTATSPSVFITDPADSVASSHSGRVKFENVIVANHGLKFHVRSGTYGGNWHFINMTYESGLDDFFTVDSEGLCTNLIIDNCEMADPVEEDIYIYNCENADTAANVELLHMDTTHLIRPGSAEDRAVEISADLSFFNAPTPDPINIYTSEYQLRLTPGILDHRWIGGYWQGGASLIPGDVLNLSQDASTWNNNSQVTITTGKLAHDGAYNAALIDGGDGAATIGTVSLPYTAVGDWLIVGHWVKNTSSTETPGLMQLYWASDALRLNGDATQAFLTEYSEVARSDGGWHFVCKPFKVTTAGSTSLSIEVLFRHDAGAADAYYAYPFVVHVPAGSYSDYEVRMLARSMRAAQAGARLGDYSPLAHQKLSLGGGSRLISGTASPTTGTWLKGDVVLNSSPDAAEVERWLCTASGTQGTLTGVTGSISSGTRALTVNSATDLRLGQYITIAGVTGTKKIVRIVGTTVTIDTTASHTVATAAVAFSSATFANGATIGVSTAPTDATYITQTANGTLTNEQALGDLATGLLGVTTTTGVVSSGGTTGSVDKTLLMSNGTGGKTVQAASGITSPAASRMDIGSVVNATAAPLRMQVDGSGVGFIVSSDSSSDSTRFISGGVKKGLFGIGSVPFVIETEGDINLTPTTGVVDGSFITNLKLSKTITGGGTTGAQTINKATGSVNFAASAASLVVTNSMVTANSIILCTVATNDATMKSVQAVAGSGSFTLYPNANPTGETRVNFMVTNQFSLWPLVLAILWERRRLRNRGGRRTRAGQSSAGTVA